MKDRQLRSIIEQQLGIYWNDYGECFSTRHSGPSIIKHVENLEKRLCALLKYLELEQEHHVDVVITRKAKRKKEGCQ